MSSQCSLQSVGAAAAKRLSDAITGYRAVKQGQLLFRSGEKFSNVYAIRSGSLKAVVTHPDGHEQITRFHIVGDVLGFDGISGGMHLCDAIALEDSYVCVMPFDLLELRCQELREIQLHVHRMLSNEIAGDTTALKLLGTISAEERIKAFLVDLSSRWEQRGYSSVEFTLKMSRKEIGNYLGLSVETVSRRLSKLKKSGVLDIAGRDVVLINRADLVDRSSTTGVMS